MKAGCAKWMTLLIITLYLGDFKYKICRKRHQSGTEMEFHESAMCDDSGKAWSYGNEPVRNV